MNKFVVFSIMVCAFYFLIESTKKLIDYIRWYFGFTYGYEDKVLVLGIGIGYIKGVINGNMYLVEFPNHPLKIVSHEDITRIYRRGRREMIKLLLLAITQILLYIVLLTTNDLSTRPLIFAAQISLFLYQFIFE